MQGLDVLLKELELRDGKMDLYFCAFAQSTGLKKARLHLKPVKVLVSYTEEYWDVINGKKPSLNYREKRVKMIQYKKDGKLGKKEISTASLGCTNDSLHFFVTREECVKVYNDFIFEAIKKFEKERELVIAEFDRKIENLKNDFVDSDYILESLSR